MNFYHEMLKEIRKESRISVNYIMKRLDICRKTYWNWETGVRVPRESDVRALAKAMGVEVYEISDLTPEKPVSEDVTHIIKQDSLADSGALYGGITEALLKLNSQLKHAQATANAFLNSIRAILYIRDTSLKYIRVNEYFKQTYDLPSDYSCLGKRDNDFFIESEAEANTAEDRQVLRFGIPVQSREGYIPGTKKRKWGLISKYPLLDSESRVNGVVGTIIDITDRKKAEDQNATLKEVIEQIDECIWIALKHGRKEKYIYINDSGSKIFGYPKERIYKDPYFYIDDIAPEDKETFKNFIESKVYPKTLEYSIIRPTDRKKITLKETVYLKKELNFGVISDITERKQQEILRASYEKVLKSVDEYIWIGKDPVEENGIKVIDNVLHVFDSMNSKVTKDIIERIGNPSILSSTEGRKIFRTLKKDNGRGLPYIDYDAITADKPFESFYAIPFKDGGEINLREKVYYDPELDLYIGIIRKDIEKDEIQKAVAQNNQAIRNNLQNLGFSEDIIKKAFQGIV